jgi:catechol 2,3-dioxygenase-like lactoylglutathione lyase family enzyme
MNMSKREQKPAESLKISRRSLLLGLSVAPFAMKSMAQQAGADQINVSGLQCFTLRVSDLERSLAWYQGLFGMPVLSRVGDSVNLQIGDGPQYMTLSPTRRGENPHIESFGLAVPGFNRYRLQSSLSDHGVGRTVETAYDPRKSPLDLAELTWLERLPGDSDTMLAENHEMFFADPNGVKIKLSRPTDCGAGDLSCDSPEPSPTAGTIKLRELNHLTTFVANYETTNAFYRRLFGFGTLAHQAQFPTLDVGEDGKQFLMFVGGTQAGEPAQPGRIDHVSLNIDDFSVESVLQRLSDYGLTAREDGGEELPLQHWVSMRMPERGGAPGGTPEVYFSDPDGLALQLQHITYCGGGGVFGGECEM